MAEKGFLALGGNEIVNNSRAKAYAEGAGCTWELLGEACAGIADAVGDPAYSYANITEAPWYDPDLPDLSSRFLGVWCLAIEGIDESTYVRGMTERTAAGGRMQRGRKTSRSVRVRVALQAIGDDALEYGRSWLNAVLEPGACGQHGDQCGSADLAFFGSCPPARGTVPDYSPWVDAELNVATSPGFDDPDSIPAGGVQSGAWSVTPGGFSLYVPPAAGYGFGPYGSGPYGGTPT